MTAVQLPFPTPAPAPLASQRPERSLRLAGLGSLFAAVALAACGGGADGAAGVPTEKRAAVGDFTWAGTGASSPFSTGFTPGQPTNDTNLLFTNASATRSAVNDLASRRYTNISISAGSGATAYQISGVGLTLNNQLTVGDGASGVVQPTISLPLSLAGEGVTNVVEVQTNGELLMSGVVSSTSGALNKTGSGTLVLSGANTFAAAVAVNAGVLVVKNAAALGSSTVGTTVAAGATLRLDNATPMAMAEPVTLVSAPASPARLDVPNGSHSLSGNLTAAASSQISIATGAALALGGTLVGDAGATRNISLSGGGTLALSGSPDAASQPINLNVNGTTAVVTGNYGSKLPVNLSTNGVLRGTGSVARISACNTGSVVDPGSAANTAGSLTSASALEFCTGAKLRVDLQSGTSGDSVNAASVNLDAEGSGTLELNLLAGFSANLGESLTIINNTGAGATLGTFAGLAQNAEITSGAYKFRITYTGGTGNDVTLQVTQAPAVAEPAPAPVAPPADSDRDGVTSSMEDAVPNLNGVGTGDGNGDGLADSGQASVASLVVNRLDTNGNGVGTAYVTVVADSLNGKPDTTDTNSATITQVLNLPRPANAPRNLSLPFGLLRFSAEVQRLGERETFSVYVEGGTPVNGFWVRDKTGQWINIATAVTPEGTKTRIDFVITDGQGFDEDLFIGAITITGGPGFMPPGLGGGLTPDLSPNGFFF